MSENAVTRTDALIESMLCADGIPRCAEWDKLEAHARQLERELAALSASRASVPLTDADLRRMWLAAGGNFYGPRVETGAMPEVNLFRFLREMTRLSAAPEPAGKRVGVQFSSRNTYSNCRYLLVFADQDRGCAMFDDKAEAIAMYRQASEQWTCSLYEAIGISGAGPELAKDPADQPTAEPAVFYTTVPPLDPAKGTEQYAESTGRWRSQIVGANQSDITVKYSATGGGAEIALSREQYDFFNALWPESLPKPLMLVKADCLEGFGTTVRARIGTAEPAAQPDEVARADEGVRGCKTYWMIERGSPCEWWVGNLKIPNEDGGEWTADSSKAQHFPDDWRAKLHAAELVSWGIPGPLRATEHIDVKGPLPAQNGYCGCWREEQCGYIGTERIVRAGKCRIAAGKPFVEESAGQATEPAGDTSREVGPRVGSQPVPADPVSVEAEIAGFCSAAYENSVIWEYAIRAWIAIHGTRLQGLKEARKMLQENGCSCLADGALEQAIAALAADEKKPAHGEPVDGASGD